LRPARYPSSRTWMRRRTYRGWQRQRGGRQRNSGRSAPLTSMSMSGLASFLVTMASPTLLCRCRVTSFLPGNGAVGALSRCSGWFRAITVWLPSDSRLPGAAAGLRTTVLQGTDPVVGRIVRPSGIVKPLALLVSRAPTFLLYPCGP
jgi:hypothetical protein